MKSIILYGGTLAATIASVLSRIGGISGKYRVIHVPFDNANGPPADLESCDIFFRQDPYACAFEQALPNDTVRVAFPTLEVRHLWPLHCANPYNRPEPPRFPAGRFPYGDSFVVSCLQKNVDPDAIVKFCTSGAWGEAWPDLSACREHEIARLETMDARVDVPILPYIQEHLQQRRLFWAPAAPTNSLLSELIVRMLDRAFAPNKLISRKVLEELLHLQGAWDLFGAIAVPIHPHVAKQFNLTWYDPHERYNYFGEMLGYREYFERMLGENGPKPVFSKKDRPTLIVYGNCQAEAVGVILSGNSTISRLYDVRYVASFGAQRGRIDEDSVARCSIFLEQHDREPFELREKLPRSCTIIRFPSVDCNVLWPFNAANPYDAPEERFPFGRYPYGDRVIISQIDAGQGADEILDYYLNAWDDYKVDLDRLLKIEIARFAARDTKCDVTMGTYLYERFVNQRPLWTANHPTLPFLNELLRRILSAAVTRADKRLASVDIERTIKANFVLSPGGPLGAVSVPIHPKVAEHFRLTWYDPDERYALFDGSRYRYKDYFKDLIAHSLAKKMVAVS